VAHRSLVVLLAFAALAGAACTGSGRAGEASPSGDPSGTASAAAPTASITPSTSEGQTFSGNGVSFSYPEGWRRFRLSDSSASEGTQDWSETVGIDRRNLVAVSRFTLDVSITDANLQARTDAIRAQLESLFTQAGGALRSGPSAQEMGGLPGLSFTGTARTPDGRTVSSRLVLAFDGRTEYFVNCQYDHAGRDRIVPGCEQVVSTFSLEG
jgi:hypothetical protein